MNALSFYRERGKAGKEKLEDEGKLA